MLAPQRCLIWTHLWMPDDYFVVFRLKLLLEGTDRTCKYTLKLFHSMFLGPKACSTSAFLSSGCPRQSRSKANSYDSRLGFMSFK